MSALRAEPGRLNGAELAIVHHRFEGVARKMARTLMRTGRSGVLNRARDFSCCIVTAECELIAAAESLPIHVLSGPDHMARVMREYHPSFRPGDAFLNNSPYHGCSHAADHTILVPVMDRAGVHRYTVIAKAHQADVGNSIPTTYHGSAVDVYEEGALIFPCVQVQRDYEDVDDIVRMCRIRIRVPDQWYGDYLAMVGAARIGERELLALGGEFGWDALERFCEQWFEYSEKRMVAALGRLVNGTATASSTHDPFPGTPPSGVTITARISVDSGAGRVRVDLRDNPDSLPNGMNLSRACAETAAMVGIFNSIDHDVPRNAGSFRRIEVQLREGCVCGIPRHPTSCSVATTNIADRVANATQCAFAGLLSGSGMAEVGAVISPACGVVSGVDPRSGTTYINQVFLGMTGGAGAPAADCWVTAAHVGNAGMCFLDSVELAEVYQPMIVYDRHVLEDTEGAGEYIGANGISVEFGPRGTAMTVAYVSDGVVNPPKGVRGGLAGGGAMQFLRRADGRIDPLPSCAQILVAPDERIVSIGTGGGGYGDPLKRNAAAVAEDVRTLRVSRHRARDVYGVVLDDQGVPDLEATRRLRSVGGSQ